MRTIVSVYDTEEQARDAVQALIDAGFEREEISIAARTEGEHAHLEEPEAGEEAAAGAGAGAGLGAVVGGLTGLVIGLSTIAVPGLGAIAAAGPLAGLISGALTGVVAGGIIGALVELGVPEEEAEVYAEAVRRGSSLVAIRVADDDVREAEAVMERFDPVDVERRARRWREEGWGGYDEEAEPYTREEIRRERELYAEHEGEEYDTLIDPDEVAEIGDRSQWNEPAWREREPEFRTHYEETFSGAGPDYDYYIVAYRLGFRLATHPRYGEHQWADLEPEARQRWEDEYGSGTWSDVRDAVHTSYRRYGT